MFPATVSPSAARIRFSQPRTLLMTKTTHQTHTGPVDERVAADALFTTLYAELHRLARRELNRRGPLRGLGVTTLLHEAYLSISGTEGTSFVDHARFMGYAARVMRGLIIDDVRRRRSEKRGGLFHITALDTNFGDKLATPESLLRIGDALDELATIETDLAEIVDLKFFCGFSFAEIAAMRNVSERTVQRKWEKARLYLHRTIEVTPPPGGDADGLDRS
jgi:RNA polymerase sigma factor (TIGR02999 family)